MPGRMHQGGQRAAIARVTEAAPQSGLIREHLRTVTESPKFKGSRRSQEFLRYIVEKALEGRCEDLKERNLGVELFGRPVSYDTGEDAIVRVTASDVRRRLHQYYSEIPDTEFRFDLPSGSYIPEFQHLPATVPHITDGVVALQPLAGPKELPVSISPHRNDWWHLPAAAAAGLAVGLCFALWLGYHPAVLQPDLILPWSSIFQQGRLTHLIVCDTNIAMLQELLDTSIPLADYANRRYLRNSDVLGPDLRKATRALAGMDYTANTAFLDINLALHISELAQLHGYQLHARSARMLQLRDFKSDDNFILLGSPRSNPWNGLFQDQLDFSFLYDPARQREICLNRHPRKGELASYIPTAAGGGTGEAFAILAFLANPEESGHVLLLAGSNAEGTEAAARLATNQDLLSQTLMRYGVDPKGPPTQFEALLRVTAMGGSATRFDVIALHQLGETPAPVRDR